MAPVMRSSLRPSRPERPRTATVSRSSASVTAIAPARTYPFILMLTLKIPARGGCFRGIAHIVHWNRRARGPTASRPPRVINRRQTDPRRKRGTMSALTEMQCVACRPGVRPAPPEQLEEWLPDIPEWDLVKLHDVPRLRRTFR